MVLLLSICHTVAVGRMMIFDPLLVTFLSLFHACHPQITQVVCHDTSTTLYSVSACQNVPGNQIELAAVHFALR